MHPKPVEEIYENFKQSGVLGKIGQLLFDLDNLVIEVETPDVVGSILQEWFGKWLIDQDFKVSSPEETQAFPDFLVDETHLLEIKAFINGRNPAFDVAAYYSYIDSLEKTPRRLDASYIIFSYNDLGNAISLENVWLKKIWEIVGPSATNIITLQVKRDYPYNIRPRGSSLRSGSGGFHSRREFAQSLHRSALKFASTGRPHSPDWLSGLEARYLEATGSPL